MDEIALLQQQLAAVQQQESALKLSDHNVIDLLMKLQALGKLQVVHTLTGKQFLTPTQIEREIQDYVTLHAGRISMTELQQLLNIDRSYIEKHVAQLARSAKKSSTSSLYYVVNSGEEVVTNWYLDAIMEDTNTLLQETGTTTIGALAQQYGFAVDYMRDVVTSRLGTLLHAHERNSVLYTHSYVASQRAVLRGVLSAITRPTFVPDIARTYSVDERVVDEYVTELVSTRVLMGTLRGREYVPFVFIDAQRASMYSFFQQNGYLDHARALQLHVTRPFDFLKRRFPDAVALHACVVSHALVLQLDGAIDAAVTDSAYVDVRTVLPSAISASDMAMAVAKSPLLATGAATQLHDVFVVSTAFIDAVVASAEHDAVAKAQQAVAVASAAQLQRAMQRDASAAHSGGGDSDSDDNESGKRGSKRNTKRSTKADDEKKSKRKGGKHQTDDASKSSKSSSKKSKRTTDDTSAALSITPSSDELQSLVASWVPHGADDDDELLDAVCDYVAPRIDAIYTKALSAARSSILRGDAASLRELRRAFEDQFDDLFVLVTVLDKGVIKLRASVASENDDTSAQLDVVERHVLDTVGVDIAALVTRFVAASYRLELDGVVPFTVTNETTQDAPPPSPLVSLSDANKKTLEANLPASTASALVRLWTFAVAGRRALTDLLLHVPVLADALSMPLRKLDRKRERNAIFAYRHSVVSALDQTASDDVMATTALVLQLLFQQTFSLPATFPRDALSYARVVLDAVRPSVPDAPMATLDAFVAKALERSSQESDDDEAAAWCTMVSDVRTLVLAKDLASA